MGKKSSGFIKFNIADNRLVLLFCIISFFCQLIFILLSSNKFLATHWVLDDSYYYFKTAQNFHIYKFFTFDGINKTYGFQPLWMIICTIVSFFISEKFLFIKIILLISAILYTLCGYLFYLITKDINSLLKYIPSLIWLFNIDLFKVFVSGKENIIAALLFFIIILYLKKYFYPRKKDLFLLGIFTGLLVLTRVNYLFLIPIIIVILFRKLKFKELIGGAFNFSLGLIVICFPWTYYAYTEYDTIFPSSGLIKLYGIQALIFYKLEHILTFLNTNWIRNILSLKEQTLISIMPSIHISYSELFIKYFFIFLPENSLSFGYRDFLKTFFSKYPFLFILIILGVSILLIFYFGFSLKGKFSRIFMFSNQIKNIPTWIKFIYTVAFGDFIINLIFLPKWIFYCKWYSTFEIIAFILLLVFLANFYNKKNYKHKSLAGPKFKLSILLIVLLTLIINFPLKLYLMQYKRGDIFADEAWKAKNWIINNIDENAVLGSWSSGLLGYYLNNKVINLDGLINSNEYAKKEVFNFICYQNKLTNINLVYKYIKENNISYVAEAWFEKKINSQDFHWVIPIENFKIVYKGDSIINWNEKSGNRIYYVIKLFTNNEHSSPSK